MLCRPGRLSFFGLFMLLTFAWARWRARSRYVLDYGWQATVEKFSQGASFADDMLGHVSSHEKTPKLMDIALASATAAANSAAASAAASLVPEGVQTPSPYAYVFYATEDSYACSVLVNIQRLQEVLFTKHRIFVLASENLSPGYLKAFEDRNVTVSMQTPPPLAEGGAWYYKDCLMKLFAFKMHRVDPSLKKVIALDSDQLIMHNLDYLFDMSVEVDLAAPRAYWIAKDALSSTFLLISLSERLWKTVELGLQTIKTDKYDMDLIQDLLGDTVMMLPGHFVAPNSHWEDWNLPKWFHTSDDNGGAVVKSDAAKNDSIVGNSSQVHSTMDLSKRQVIDYEKIPEVKSDLQAVAKKMIATNHKAKNSKAIPVIKPSASDEQTDASSGDIFSYLDPVKEVTVRVSEEEDELEEQEEDDTDISEAAEAAATVERETETETETEAEAEAEAEAKTQQVASIPEHHVELKFQAATLEEMTKRPLFNELYELYPAVSVLHFFGLGKPWTFSIDNVHQMRPGAHPLFVEQFRLWRETALAVCPPGLLAGL